MRIKILKTIGMVVSLIAGMSATLTAGAAVTWAGKLGSSVVSRQIWNVTCPENTDRANFRIANQGLAQGNVIAALGKGGITTVQTDKVPAGTVEFPWGSVKQGSGIYTLVIFKDVAKGSRATESFRAEMTCDKEGVANSLVNPTINLQGGIN